MKDEDAKPNTLITKINGNKVHYQISHVFGRTVFAWCWRAFPHEASKKEYIEFSLDELNKWEIVNV